MIAESPEVTHGAVRDGSRISRGWRHCRRRTVEPLTYEPIIRTEIRKPITFITERRDDMKRCGLRALHRCQQLAIGAELENRSGLRVQGKLRVDRLVRIVAQRRRFGHAQQDVRVPEE